ncbi:hypothetical protein K439DRAFT_1638947 [Ramaria rubella]|nr:hypothetical protein K439DRAFT_1638947 [Ramaria rubella]
MKDESEDIFPLFLSPQGSRDKASAAHWEKILARDTLNPLPVFLDRHPERRVASHVVT